MLACTRPTSLIGRSARSALPTSRSITIQRGPVPLPHPAARRGATAMAGPGSHSNGPAGSEAPEAAPAPKRIKVNSGSWQHFVGPSYAVTGLLLTDHRMTVPLDHSGKVPGTIDVFFRELVHRNKKDDKGLGYLLFLQGGPGFEAARPTDLSGWVKQAANYFRIILLDQRGTGRSTAVTCDNLSARGSPQEQAQYLKFFRLIFRAWLGCLSMAFCAWLSAHGFGSLEFQGGQGCKAC